MSVTYKLSPGGTLTCIGDGMITDQEVTKLGKEKIKKLIINAADIHRVDDAAFYMCEKLKEVAISDGVKVIGNNGFQDCKSITEVRLPKSVQELQYAAFSSCENLRKINLNTGCTTIGRYCFYMCEALEEITMPAVTTIEGCAFYGCTSLKKITIPATVTSIGDEVFVGCDNLKDIYFEGTEEAWGKLDVDLPNPFIVIHYCGEQ